MKVQNTKRQRGSALLITMFALVLLLAVAFVMIFMSITDNKITNNFKQNKLSYYAARAGLEEVRDRMGYPSATNNGLSDKLPTVEPGKTGGVLYVLNPDTTIGEAVDPTDTTAGNKYFDFELCRQWNDAAAKPRGQRCTTVPTAANWSLPTQNSLQAGGGAVLPFKWVRVTLKTNRGSWPYCADGGACASATLDNRVCYDGKKEFMNATAGQPCPNGNLQVYQLTSYALGRSGGRSLVRYETVILNPPRLSGVIEMESPNRSRGDFKGPSVPPLTTIDGRAHNIDGTLAQPGGSCASTSPFASDATTANGNGDELPGDLSDLESQIAANQCTGLTGLAATQCTNGFLGNAGNLANGMVNQQPQSTVQGQVAPVDMIINQLAGQPGTITLSGNGDLGSKGGTVSGNTRTYGSLTNPVFVNAGQQDIDGGNNIVGFGILVVSHEFEIKNINFQWTGIVIIKDASDTTEFRIDTNATGSITGALIMQGTEARARTSDSDSGVFSINYSCAAIDMAFNLAASPVIAYNEVSY